MDYVDSEGFLTIKGRTITRFSSPFDILICEMLFGGHYANLTPEELCALVGLFVSETRGDLDKKNVTEPLIAGITELDGILKSVMRLEN